MGMLQQMVHVLRQIDPENTLWRELMEKRAVELSRDAYSQENENERTARLENIAQAFNRNVNDPDYARKLFLIEHCIFGVDIQPIATQISKLRFFISLVVDQRPTKDASDNFGIRPLPNLESNFVTANTLVPLDREKNLFTNHPDVIFYERKLKDFNHRLFQCKNSAKKKELSKCIENARCNLAQVMENLGAISTQGHDQLIAWNMFDQNASSPFFDPEWMFGVKDGFDVIIGNPPYVSIRTKSFDNSIKDKYRRLYSLAIGQYDLYTLFIEHGYFNLQEGGVLSFIIPTRMLSNENFMPARKFIIKNIPIYKYVNALMPFEMASVEANIMICLK